MQGRQGETDCLRVACVWLDTGTRDRPRCLEGRPGMRLIMLPWCPVAYIYIDHTRKHGDQSGDISSSVELSGLDCLWALGVQVACIVCGLWASQVACIVCGLWASQVACIVCGPLVSSSIYLCTCDISSSKAVILRLFGLWCRVALISVHHGSCQSEVIAWSLASSCVDVSARSLHCFGGHVPSHPPGSLLVSGFKLRRCVCKVTALLWGSRAISSSGRSG